jgi:hypothetical protein
MNHHRFGRALGGSGQSEQHRNQNRQYETTYEFHNFNQIRWAKDIFFIFAPARMKAMVL